MSRLISDETWAVLTIWAEARGEVQLGRIAVAEVIRNRTAVAHLGCHTVAATVLAPYQFSCWNTRDPNRLTAALLDDADLLVRACRDAWREAEDGSAVANEALYYLNPQVVRDLPAWVDDCDEVAQIGRHRFYRPKGRRNG